MKLEQQTQILTPTKLKKQRTIPPELLVDIFKTINTYPYELSRGLWIMYAKKLMTSSSIVYLSAGNAFRQCKKSLKNKLIYLKMSGENIDEFSLCEEDANKILLNGQSEDKNDKEFWAELFLRLLAKKRMLDSDNKRALDYRTEEVINLQFENNRLKFLNKNLTDGAKEGMETSSVISSPFSSPDKASSVTPKKPGATTMPKGICSVCAGALDLFCPACQAFAKKHGEPPKKPCGKTGTCTGAAVLSCAACRYKTIKEFGYQKSPKKPSKKRENEDKTETTGSKIAKLQDQSSPHNSDEDMQGDTTKATCSTGEQN
uniref:Uncharacterized protein n=1 Tax=Meloidogyne enterolobii TaxID=390850 RepID=A0A6V7TJW5_MELEN|nr:unnamed protein product [Meloidogyne enterolobii]